MNFTLTEWVIFLMIGAALFILGHKARKLDKETQELIAQRYPEEWQRMSADKMGMRANVLLAAKIEESINSGFLKNRDDQEIASMHKRAKLFRNLSFAALLAAIILPGWYF